MVFETLSPKETYEQRILHRTLRWRAEANSLDLDDHVERAKEYLVHRWEAEGFGEWLTIDTTVHIERDLATLEINGKPFSKTFRARKGFFTYKSPRNKYVEDGFGVEVRRISNVFHLGERQCILGRERARSIIVCV